MDDIDAEIEMAISRERQTKKARAAPTPTNIRPERPAPPTDMPPERRAPPTDMPPERWAQGSIELGEPREGEFEEGEVQEAPDAETGTPPHPAMAGPIPLEDLPDAFDRLEIDRRAKFKILTLQLAREAAEVKKLSEDFEDHYSQDTYAEAAFVADKLINLLYSMYEKQSMMTRSATNVLVVLRKSLLGREEE